MNNFSVWKTNQQQLSFIADENKNPVWNTITSINYHHNAKNNNSPVYKPNLQQFWYNTKKDNYPVSSSFKAILQRLLIKDQDEKQLLSV